MVIISYHFEILSCNAAIFVYRKELTTVSTERSGMNQTPYLLSLHMDIIEAISKAVCDMTGITDNTPNLYLLTIQNLCQ